MRNRVVVFLAPIFALTGFSALTLQVVWQRVISLHSGVDLASVTTVVAAFLAGLGFGSLLGGNLADRLGPRRSLGLFSLTNLAIGAFAWISLYLFYDLYEELGSSLQSTATTFLFNAAILIVPTTLMGLSLPLVARAITATVDDAGPLIGRMYGINTIGAGVGAAVAGWYFLGEFGFTATVRIAGSLNIIASLLIFGLYRTVGRETAAAADTAVAEEPAPVASNERIWPWFVIYGLTGAVALGLEQVFFRIIDAEMRSNSYSFAHVLTLYLLLFGAGSAIGSRLVRRGGDPRKWFLWLQFAVGVTALLAIVGFIRILPNLGLETRMQSYFSGEGYNGGFGTIDTWRKWGKVIGVFGVVPLGLMAAPVLCMGMSFPFVQRIVTDKVATLGRRTGALLFTNICGNVVGTLATGFVLIDAFGTAGTLKVLTGLLGIAGLAAAWLAPPSRRVAHAGLAVVLLGTMLAVTPSNKHLWAFFHGTTGDNILLEEDHACATTIRFFDEQATLFINASIQNGHPFDDFHVLIGLLPALMHPDPKEALAIGLGIGSTTYGMLQDPRLEHIETVELCGAQYDLIRKLGEQGRGEFTRMLSDPRYKETVGDGRKFLLKTDTEYDLMTVDTLRTTSAFSGSLYSKEFYELVNSRLNDTGIFTQWVPAPRVANSAAQVFPYLIALRVDGYNYGSVFMIGSRSPIKLDRQQVLDRLHALDPASFTKEQALNLEIFISFAEVFCYNNGTVLSGVPSYAENRDLRPRDEYFVNNGLATTLPAC